MGLGYPLAQAPTRKAARANDCLFDSTMTTYITASLHYLEAIPPIRHLEDKYKFNMFYSFATILTV